MKKYFILLAIVFAVFSYTGIKTTEAKSSIKDSRVINAYKRNKEFKDFSLDNNIKFKEHFINVKSKTKSYKLSKINKYLKRYIFKNKLLNFKSKKCYIIFFRKLNKFL